MKRLLFFLFLLPVHSVKSQDLSKIIYPDTFENSKSCIARNNIATETVYEFTALDKGSDSTLAQLITYDQEGNILNKESWTNGRLLRKESYVYAADKKVQQIIKEYFTLNEYWVSEFEYDSFGNEIREYIYNRDTTTLITYAKVYNDKNKISAYYSALNTDSFKLEKAYSYDDDILTKIEVYDYAEKVIGIYSYIVGSNKMYKKASYVDLKKKDQNVEYIFDKANNCVRVNGLVVRPKIYLNGPLNADRNDFKKNIIAKTDIRRTEKNMIPKVEGLEYNLDGTLALISERVEGRITKVRRYYYTRY